MLATVHSHFMRHSIAPFCYGNMTSIMNFWQFADVLKNDADNSTDGNLEGTMLRFAQMARNALWTCRAFVDLSGFCPVPSARFSHLPFESDGAFPAQC